MTHDIKERMSLGLESGTVRVVPYDSEWPALFSSEAQRLRDRFASADLTIAIEHTGSTAVPGLAAKPILDILAGYPPGSRVEEYTRLLVEAGYVHRGEQEIPGREFFRRGNPRAYHVHLTAVDSAFWRDHITFRDRLRQSAEVRDAYAALKQDLTARFPRDREAYIDAKGPFVKKVLGASTDER